MDSGQNEFWSKRCSIKMHFNNERLSKIRFSLQSSLGASVFQAVLSLNERPI